MSEEQPDSPTEPRHAGTTAALIGIATAITVTVLLGWTFRVEPMKRIAPGLTSMNPLTATGFLLACVALWLVQSPQPSLSRFQAARGLGILCLLIGTSKLIDLGLGTSLCPDDVLFRSQLNVGQPFPSRIAPNTAGCMALLGAAIARIGKPTRPFLPRADLLVLPILVVSLAAIVGYIYNSSGFYEYKQYIPMALHTALNFQMLSVALLLQRPQQGFLRTLPPGSSGTRSFTRLLPACILTPAVLGIAELFGAHRGWFVAETGASWIAVLSAVAMTIVVYLNAVSLNQLDAQRQKSLRDLLALVAQLQKTQIDLQAANSARTAFLANMSHEIRTPMNAIIGLTTLVMSGPLEATQRDHIGKVLSSSQSLLRILNDILEYTKLESGRLSLEVVDFNLDAAMQALVSLFAPKAKEKGLSLEVRIADGTPQDLIGDEFRLGQILNNLVGNAIKFTESGDVRVSVEVASQTDAVVELGFKVADTGIGMSEEQQRGLFEAFSQADSSITRRYGGSGLGLAIARSIVELMGGHIEIDSAPGRGTTFRFTARFNRSVRKAAPVAAADSALPQPAAAAKAWESAPQLRGRRVLLVEDLALNRLVATSFLEKLGIECECAENGTEAIERVGRAAYDAILMDMHMPKMDGLEATRRIRLIDGLRELPIIAMSAAAMASDIARCREAGMNDHIPKPLEVETLVRTLSKWIPPP